VGPVSMQVHVPLIDKRMGQIISITDSAIQVMDSETFETLDMNMVEDELKGKIQQGQDVEYWKVMDRTKIMRIKS
ncbi:MAG TPA: translation initiation factor IF-5A, partial [Candidatus Nitrosotenuis sp.]